MSTRQTSPRWILGLTSVPFFMVALDALVVTTALPAIQRDLRVSLSTLEWTVNAYGLTFAAGIITAAALGDRLGRRRVFIAGLALFSVASACCALAPSPALLVAARAVQGIGAAAVMPLSLTILTSSFPPERRGAVVGIWGAIGGLAVASGPVIGGAITQGIDWHWIFWVNVPIGLAALVLSRLRLPESRVGAPRLDPLGLALITGASVGLVWGLVRSGAAGWTSGEVLASLIAATMLLGAFVAWERRAPAPMLPAHLFTNRAFAAANATAFLMMGAITGAAFLMAQYFQLSLGDSPLATGLKLLPWTATPVFVAPLAGAFSDRVGPRRIMAVGLVLQAAGLSWFALRATDSVRYATLVVPLILAGVGISMAIPTTPAAALGAVSPSELGKASGAVSTLQRFGGALGVAVVTAVFTAHGHLGTAGGYDQGFRPALAAAAGLSLAGAVAALLIPSRSRPASVLSAERAAAPAPTG